MGYAARASEGTFRGVMDASGCMKSLLLAATQYRAAKTPSNAALVQRSLEVRAERLGPSEGLAAAFVLSGVDA